MDNLLLLLSSEWINNKDKLLLINIRFAKSCIEIDRF